MKVIDINDKIIDKEMKASIIELDKLIASKDNPHKFIRFMMYYIYYTLETSYGVDAVEVFKQIANTIKDYRENKE